MGDKDVVSRSYDGIAKTHGKTSVEERQRSQTIHLRQFNNWIKSALIDRFCPSPYATVFDCACGKGGDIPKWKLKEPNQFIFGDISLDSLDFAYAKYQSVKSKSRAFFIGGDIFSSDLSTLIPSDIKFHISSCQFAFHYCFREEALARSAVRNLCERLLPGGYILLTIPNACRIVKLLRESKTTKISNSLFSIERRFDLDNIPLFGAEYIFDLVESVDQCPEYLVHPAVMISLFEEYNCELVETYPFHEYYHEVLRSYPKMAKLFSDLLQKLRSFENADMTPDEWDTIGLYSFYVFQKNGALPSLPRSPEYNVPKYNNTFEIIDAKTGEIRKSDITELKQQKYRNNK